LKEEDSLPYLFKCKLYSGKTILFITADSGLEEIACGNLWKVNKTLKAFILAKSWEGSLILKYQANVRVRGREHEAKVLD
jgi:hypothetical protein